MKYTMIGPDGKEHSIEGPEGATRSEVKAKIKDRMAKQQNQVVATPDEISLADQRADISQGATMRFGPWDTGIGIPQWADEGLAGMGRQFMELGTAGTHQGTADELLDDSIPAAVGGLAADIAAGVVTGGALGTAAKGLSAAPKIAKGLKWAGDAISAPTSLAKAGAGGAAYGGLLADGSIQDRARGAAEGAAGGLLGYGALKGAEKIISPQMADGAQELLDAKVPLTPGQMLGGRAAEMEEQFSSIPFAGAMARGARRRGVEAWNRSKYNEALGAAGKGALPDNVKTGEEALRYAHGKVSEGYDEVIDNMPVVADEKMFDMLRSVPDDWDLMEESTQKHITWGLRQIEELATDPNPTGRAFKRADSRLRERVAQLTKGDRAQKEKEAGRVLQSMHATLKEIASDQHPKLGKKLAGLDKAYAMLRTAGAASIRSGKDELFTPAQLRAEIKKRADTKAMYTGVAPGYQEIKPAMELLPNVVPDSGTAGRALLASLIAGGSGLIDPTPATATTLAGLTALYTKPGSALFRAYAKPSRPQQLLGGGVGALAPAGGLLGRREGDRVNPNRAQ
jgi:hypothetical protein